MTGLTSLQLSNIRMNSRLGPAIAKIEKLECLVIRAAEFDDEDVKHLASLRHLKVLYLGHTAITDAGLASLENLSHLGRLSLCNTKVSNRGIRYLSKLPLTALDLRRTAVNNACLPILAEMPLLEATLIEETGVSESRPDFIGVVDGSVWYANAVLAKAARETPNDEE